jgi:hypothetical protein
VVEVDDGAHMLLMFRRRSLPFPGQTRAIESIGYLQYNGHQAVLADQFVVPRTGWDFGKDKRAGIEWWIHLHAIFPAPTLRQRDLPTLRGVTEIDSVQTVSLREGDIHFIPRRDFVNILIPRQVQDQPIPSRDGRIVVDWL